MLADQLLASNDELKTLTFGGLDLYQDRLRRAGKFVLDRSIGEVAGDMPRQAVRDVMPFCRLPFETCWIEIAQQDRPFLADAFHHGPNHSGKTTYQPGRVGILCEQQGDNPQRFYATLAWTYNAADMLAQGLDTPVSICPWGLSIWCDTPDAEIEEPFSVRMMVAPYWRAGMLKIAQVAPPATFEQLKRNADHDWAGEPWFWLAVLALLNAKNGASSTFTPAAPALNKSRAKAGKPPLVDFHQLTLRIGPRAAPEPRGGASRSPGRAHTVRGHFKIRKSGVYWWRPFIRGEVAEGFVGKTYKVKV
jgi:hypothetical protein